MDPSLTREHEDPPASHLASNEERCEAEAQSTSTLWHYDLQYVIYILLFFYSYFYLVTLFFFSQWIILRVV